MTLYSKWSTGKNITFIGLIVMFIALLIPWLSTGKMEKELGVITVDQMVKLFDQLEGLINAMGSEYAKEVRAFKFVYHVNRLRWLFLIPMIYPAVFLFWYRAKKNIACISSLVAVLVPLVLFFFAIGVFNGAIWLYIIGALVCFLGCTMDVPVKKAAVPPAPVMTPPVLNQETPVETAPAKKFCPVCGTPNLPNAKFCESCGKELPE